MATLLKALGAIFLALLLAAAIAAAILIPKAFALDREAAEFVAEKIPIVVSSWNVKDLSMYSSSEFAAELSGANSQRMFASFSRLGKLKAMTKPVGEVRSRKGFGEFSSATGVLGQYTASAEFEAGSADVELTIKRYGSSWQIVGMHINSPVLQRP